MTNTNDDGDDNIKNSRSDRPSPDDACRRLVEMAHAGPPVPQPTTVPLGTDVGGSSSSWTHILKLDLSGRQLESLPDTFPRAFPNISILFLSGNRFHEMPAVIGQCHHLQMVAFRNNQMQSIHPDALQQQLRWLILTQNQLTSLPDTIGRCHNLRKLMLSGNQLTHLPDSISQCTGLELVRLASNQLQEPPVQLLQLPHLAWIALSDNPFLHPLERQLQQQQQQSSLSTSERGETDDGWQTLLDWDESHELEGQVLGSGAGGIIRKVQYRGQWVACKAYGTSTVMTSDGLPSMERNLTRVIAQAIRVQPNVAKIRPHLVQVYGVTPNSASLVMEYLDGFKALALPPSMESCTRDVYPHHVPDPHTNQQEVPIVTFTCAQAERTITNLLLVLITLHQELGICHGDFYGHNILYRHDMTTSAESSSSAEDDAVEVRLTDFGAAFLYDRQAPYATFIQRTELRALAVLIDEMVQLIVDHPPPQEDEDNSSDNNNKKTETSTTTALLSELASKCREESAQMEKVRIWWEQQRLAKLAKVFDEAANG